MIHPDIIAFYTNQGLTIEKGCLYYWAGDYIIATVEACPNYMFNKQLLSESQMLRLIKLKAFL